MLPDPRSPGITRLGDDALLVTFAQAISRDTAARVRAVARRLCALRSPSIVDIVPAYTTLAVYFDPATADADAVQRDLERALCVADTDEEEDSRLIEIPVRYDGPDLSEVAERTGMTVRKLIEAHVSPLYYAYMSGFVPGFAYLGDLDPALVLPRRSVPRVRVPAGSVAIAGAQTAVYPLGTPGGWHLIGTTSAVVFDARRAEPALIRAGDSVRFVEMDA